VRYAKGDGVPKDVAEAAKWHRKAAEQGDADAQFTLGVMYASGEGVVKDTVEAHAWWNVASALGHERAKKGLGLIEKQMTREQIAEATKLAKERFEKFAPKN
jgi:TPR repeat protein